MEEKNALSSSGVINRSLHFYLSCGHSTGTFLFLFLPNKKKNQFSRKFAKLLLKFISCWICFYFLFPFRSKISSEIEVIIASRINKLSGMPLFKFDAKEIKTNIFSFSKRKSPPTRKKYIKKVSMKSMLLFSLYIFRNDYKRMIRNYSSSYLLL